MTKFSGNYSVYICTDWITNIHKQYKGKIAVVVELSKGPIVYALQKLDFVTTNPVNPSMLGTYRKAFSPSGAKDVPTDATKRSKT